MQYIRIIFLIFLFPIPALADFEGIYFRGYECTQDCSGHVAGFNWAIENGLNSPEQCGGKSDSFIEGCISAFIEGNPDNVTLVKLKKSEHISIGCVGSDSYGDPCYDGYGGPLYDGYGGPLYDGYGGALYDGYGGNCYDGYGGDMSKCPVLCR